LARKNLSPTASFADAQLDGALPKSKKALINPSLLILDDFGLGEITIHTAQFLLDLIDRRMRTSSLLITSQFGIDQWHGLFPTPLLPMPCSNASCSAITGVRWRVIRRGPTHQKWPKKRKTSTQRDRKHHNLTG
jgi:DNA replication protein DnaC